MTGVVQEIKQASVEAIVTRPQPCASHPSFDPACGSCRATPPLQENLGTIAHYHADGRKQAKPSLLSRGRKIWRR